VGVVVGDNWERVVHLFDLPTFIIAGALLVAAVIWYLRRRRRRQVQVPSEP
jgi:LPXTG-motif cell wall-anchored protein